MNVQGKIRSPKIQATLKNLEPTPAFLYPQYPVNTQKWRAFWCEEVISTRSLVCAHLTSGFLPLLPSFWDREHHYIIQAALNPLAWASWVLGLQACSTRYPLNPSPQTHKIYLWILFQNFIILVCSVISISTMHTKINPSFFNMFYNRRYLETQPTWTWATFWVTYLYIIKGINKVRNHSQQKYSLKQNTLW